MVSAFSNSVFYELIFNRDRHTKQSLNIMGGISGSSFKDDQLLSEVPLIIFDFETTGLDTKSARIVEIGAIKYINRKMQEPYFSYLIDPEVPITKDVTLISGITSDMLKGAPKIQQVLPEFHEFMRGCVGIAHNAEFDCGMLVAESQRLGIACAYTVFCTLRMSKAMLPQLERKNLDTLAKHYGLQFESRHRSIGDIKVTAEIFWKLLEENPHLKTIGDLRTYQELLEPIK